MKRVSPLLNYQCKAIAPSETVIGEIANMQLVTSAVQSINSATDNYIADISAVRKRLVVGDAAPGWISEHTVDCPPNLFRRLMLQDGAYLVRIHRSQYIIVDGPDSERYDELFTLPRGRHGDVLMLDYECAEIALGGPSVENIMSELCPMPLQDLDDSDWCATRMAHADVIITPAAEGGRHYRIIVTPADARFVYDMIWQAANELGARQIGQHDYFSHVCSTS